jgi:hypothetical protein
MDTKFTINQKVYFIANGAILQGVIRGIKSIFISNYSENLTTTYYIKYSDSCDPMWVNEYSIFKDKTDLTNHIYRL